MTTHKIPEHRPIDRDRPTGSSGARSNSRGGRMPSKKVVMEGISLRENLLKRLKRLSTQHADASKPPNEVRRELMDLLLQLRTRSLEVVDAIVRWRVQSGRPNASWINDADGENYLLRMKSDTTWLYDSPLGELDLLFSPKSDPFFVYPSAVGGLKEGHPLRNKMTPRLRRPGAKGLPLAPSALKLIRKAEMVILEEALRNRIASGGIPKFDPDSRVDVPDSPPKPPKPVSTSTDAPPAPVASAPSGPPTAAPSGPAAAAPASAAASAPPVSTAALGADLVLFPVDCTLSSAKELLEKHRSRVNPRLALSLNWPDLSTPESIEKVQDAEWYWLMDKTLAEVPGLDKSASAEGLIVFQHNKQKSIVTLIHLSVVGSSDEYLGESGSLSSALAIAKRWAFETFAIRSVRHTLWYSDCPELEDPQKTAWQIDPELTPIFKFHRFRWFQLTNTSDGRRGQVMNSPRFEEVDPPAPEEFPCVSVGLGISLLLDTSMAKGNPLTNNSEGAEHHFPLLVAECVRSVLRSRTKNGKADSEAEGILHGDGEVCEPDDQYIEDSLPDPELAKLLDSSGIARLPLSLVSEASVDTAKALSAMIQAGAWGEDMVATASTRAQALNPRLAVGAAMRIQCDWSEVCQQPMLRGSFDVAVHVLGRSASPAAGLEGDVFYLATDQDDLFVVVMPCDRESWDLSGADRLTRGSRLCEASIKTIQTAEPQDPEDNQAKLWKYLRFPSDLGPWSSCREIEVPGQEDKAERLLELSSFATIAGRVPGGRLRNTTEQNDVFILKKPFVVGFWHAGLDEINMPLYLRLIPL